jgi:hypothetical protein
MRVVMVAEFDHAQGVQVNVALAYPTAVTGETTPDSPPDYVFDLIQISILAAAGDVQQLIGAVETARQRGAENREILRAMFRSDDAFGAGVENEEFRLIAESLQAGIIPVPTF